jgi:quinol-cytochrome oxidoreductase complex cytochrome b subunit
MADTPPVPLARASRLLLGAVVAVAAVLAVTGVWLTFTYRPDAAQAWRDLDLPSAGIGWTRMTHQVAAALLVPLVVAFLVVGVVAYRRWRLAAALLITTLALAYTGLLLPWDQLALWAVTTGTDYQGMLGAAFGDEVRFVLFGGVEIGQAALRLWFLVHTVALTVVFAGLLASAARSVRSSSYPPPEVSPPPSSDDRWSNQSRTARS